MVRRALRSRSIKKTKVKTPGGRVVTHYKKRIPSVPHCSSCGDVLKGIPRLRTNKLQNISKSKKRPERPFGGVLCSKCMREVMKEKAKSLK